MKRIEYLEELKKNLQREVHIQRNVQIPMGMNLEDFLLHGFDEIKELKILSRSEKYVDFEAKVMDYSCFYALVSKENVTFPDFISYLRNEEMEFLMDRKGIQNYFTKEFSVIYDPWISKEEKVQCVYRYLQRFGLPSMDTVKNHPYKESLSYEERAKLQAFAEENQKLLKRYQKKMKNF